MNVPTTIGKCVQCGYAAANQKKGKMTCDDCWNVPTTIEEALQQIQPGEWSLFEDGLGLIWQNRPWTVSEMDGMLTVAIRAKGYSMDAETKCIADVPRQARSIERAIRAYHKAMAIPGQESIPEHKTSAHVDK